MSYKKEAYLKNLEYMASELIKIASNKDLSLPDHLRQVKNLKEEYVKNKAELETEAKSKCAICQQEFDNWEDYNAHRLMEHKPDLVKKPVTSALKVNVFNRDWNVTSIMKDSSFGYDISDNSGKKVMHIKPANGKQWSESEIKAAIHNELTHGFKQGKLTEKVAFLEKGSKVVILATSKDKKQVKFADLSNGVRGWVPSTKIKLLALESQKVQHGEHSDPVLGASGTETLLDCVNEGPIWVNSAELLDANRPPATPESFHEEPHIEEEAAKDCPNCERCVGCSCTCHNKKALKTALPPTIPNQRGYLDNPPVDKNASGCDQCNAIMINNKFCHETGCPNQRKDRDWEDMEMEGSLNKIAIIVEENGKFCVRSPKNKKWNGGCFYTRAAAEKRLAEVEAFKHMKGGLLRPFSKKAEVLIDPYQELHTQVQSLRDRMNTVQERLQSNPVPKQAGENEQDNSSLSTEELLSDLTMGIDLLETKLNDEITPEIHENLEQMENLLWETEQKLGITPKLSPEEKAEPEHKTIVEEVEKESSKKISTLPGQGLAAPCTNCGHGVVFKDGSDSWFHNEEMHDEQCKCRIPDNSVATGNPPIKEAAPIPTDSPTSPVMPTPLPQDIRPTDEDNLESPVQPPKSPLPTGQKWVFDSVNKKYIAMTDPAASPGKII